MRSALVQKLNTITTGYLTNHESGAIASVFVNDADTINSLYSDGVVGMIADLFQLIGLLFVIFTRSIGLGLIILIVMPLILVMTRRFQKASLASQKQNRAAIDKALAMVGLTDIVKNLPQGLNTPVSDINLSQGQLQLLMIARSVVCDPQILLLDEMTASLDRETEAKVLKAIDAASSGRTVLSISHRREAHDGRIIKL